MINLPLLLYVPGLLPKPEPGLHRDALFRCLIAGLRRYDEKIALDIAANLHCFDIVSWTYNFYKTHRDIAIDQEAIEAVIEQPGASPEDIAEAMSWRRRVARWAFSLADFIPFLIPHVANERMELHLRDLRRYTRNQDEIAEHTRQMLKMRLRAAVEARRPILLIGHSMGSVISWDSLWQMSRNARDQIDVDLLLTMGSPLGQRFIQRRLLGHDQAGDSRYLQGIRRWINLSAIGDLTALDPDLADDFEEMIKRGLVESIEDHFLHNYFRLDGVLNPHAEYGYLANEVTAKIVAEWWQACRSQAGDHTSEIKRSTASSRQAGSKHEDE
ncbi:MAG: hypothetical protein OEM85_10225 [Gammaproteobacteria bacterium]|nr:hypothetical protein [Gammaproteobacteria bacterium]